MGFSNVLIIDDDSEVAMSLAKALKGALATVQFHACTSPEMALEIAKERSPQVAVLDLCLEPGGSGVEGGFKLLTQILENEPTTRIIVLTGHSSVQHGVRALNLGAANFLEKPAEISHISALIKDAICQSEMRREFQRLRKNFSNDMNSVLRGSSGAIQKVRDSVQQACQTSQSVLILGETGTGKGLCAWAIHHFGKRGTGRFVRYQPMYASSDLINSDLFGHVKGSFTGAGADRKGLILEADRGTLFLDEIEELPLETQVSLLGVLQERKLRRVGADNEVSVDFRLICASNQDLREGMQQGKLRSDFYHRIAHMLIEIPPLRARKEDIGALAVLVLENLQRKEQLSVGEIDRSALNKLGSYDWPGNVRELEASIEGAAYRASFAGRQHIVEEDIQLGANTSPLDLPGFHGKVESFKLALVEEALRGHGGNQAQAAKALRMDRTSLRRILERSAKQGD